MVLLTMPTAVELFMWMGVGGWGCPISSRASHIIFVSIALRNRAPSSALAAETGLHFRMVHRAKTTPLMWMGHLSLGKDPRKKFPPGGEV